MSKQFMSIIAPSSISLGVIPFNLFIPDQDKKLILFCRKDYSVTQRHLDTLENNNRTLYIGSDDMEAYMNYAADRIDLIINSPDIRVADKAKIVSKLSKRTIRNLMSNPESQEAVKQTEQTVESYVDLIYNSKDSAECIFSLSSTDNYFFSHGINVLTISILIGEKLFGNDRDSLYKIGLAGMLHDVGMTRVSAAITHKHGTLTTEEWLEVKKHPLHSFDILKEFSLPAGVLAAARGHHERFDGSGYPSGLSGNDIHLYARIVALADVYDALTSDRSYSQRKPNFNALQEIARDIAGFDPELFDLLLSVVLRNDQLINDFKNSMITVGGTVQA